VLPDTATVIVNSSVKGFCIRTSANRISLQERIISLHVIKKMKRF